MRVFRCTVPESSDDRLGKIFGKERISSECVIHLKKKQMSTLFSIDISGIDGQLYAGVRTAITVDSTVCYIMFKPFNHPNLNEKSFFIALDSA